MENAVPGKVRVRKCNKTYREAGNLFPEKKHGTTIMIRLKIPYRGYFLTLEYKII